MTHGSPPFARCFHASSAKRHNLLNSNLLLSRNDVFLQDFCRIINILQCSPYLSKVLFLGANIFVEMTKLPFCRSVEPYLLIKSFQPMSSFVEKIISYTKSHGVENARIQIAPQQRRFDRCSGETVICCQSVFWCHVI
jgi:hypothetical protein